MLPLVAELLLAKIGGCKALQVTVAAVVRLCRRRSRRGGGATKQWWCYKGVRRCRRCCRRGDGCCLRGQLESPE
jgi:hypothetical protein